TRSPTTPRAVVARTRRGADPRRKVAGPDRLLYTDGPRRCRPPRETVPMSIDWTPLARFIADHERFLVTSHVRPDGDALGSSLAMAGLLRHFGKDARVVNVSLVPPRYDFLDPEGSRIGHFGTSVQPADHADREALVIVDLSSWGQLGEMA